MVCTKGVRVLGPGGHHSREGDLGDTGELREGGKRQEERLASGTAVLGDTELEAPPGLVTEGGTGCLRSRVTRS